MTDPQPKYRKDYRPPAYLADRIDLDVNIHDDHTVVRSVQAIRRTPEAPAEAPLVLDGRDMELLEIAVDDQALSPERYEKKDDGLIFFQPPSVFRLTVTTRIRPDQNTSLEGLYRSGPMLCTQCEAEGFRKITFALDRPDVMSVYTCRITADKTQYPVLLSNGNLVEKGDLADGRHFVRWEDPFKKPSYLFALVAGDLALREDRFTTRSGREVALRIYVEPQNADKCAHAIRSLQKAMKWDEEVYHREYDLDIYMIVAVSHFNMGAMENKGLNVFNAKYVLADPQTATDGDFLNIEGVIAHEYFHNWTGNRITLKNWFQLSLKEGLTVFRDQEFSADMGSRAVKRIADARKLRAHQFPEDAGPMAHPVRPESYIQMNNFYTQTVYSKGAEVIRMIQTLIGRDAFLSGMNLYFERHDGQAVTVEDFVRAMEDASGKDLSRFRLWYSQAGTPEIEADRHYDASDQTFTLTLRQHTPATPGQPEKQAMFIPVATGLIGPDGRDMPLKPENAGQTDGGTQVLLLDRTEQRFVFTDITAEPVPSLFRGFSAPVKVKDALRFDELFFLLAHDSDPFNRWNAGQELFLRMAVALAADAGTRKPLTFDVRLADAIRRVIRDERIDKALVAETLALPTEGEIAEHMAGRGLDIDPDAVHEASDGIRRFLAEELRADFLAVYENAIDTGPYRMDSVSMARRKLKNRALEFIGRLGTDEAADLVYRQFRSANNMTDEIAALNVLANLDSDPSNRAIEDFYRKWSRDPLVMEKWFAIQASSEKPGALLTVKNLMAHPDFSMTNPNKVRSLIGVFCSGNPWNFHHASGGGYEFLADQVLVLNRINPQVASRMASMFNSWRKYEPGRRALMRKQLERIHGEDNLSTDVFEIVGRALA